MPIKRSPEEGGRPPLARGSACHRCFSRKVRCSGQPDPSSGMHACTSCLRTARFKGHDLAVARCAFNGEGLCSEEGGVTMTGEVYANAGPGPTPRRKMGSRTATGSSTGSARSSNSHASQASSAVTDFSFNNSPALGSTISPVSSNASLKSLVDAAAAPSAAPSPEMYQLPPPVTYQLPPVMPHNPYATFPPPHLAMPPYSTSSLPATPVPASPNLNTPTAANPGAPSILTRRANAAPMSISLPPHPAQAMGMSPVVSRAPSPVQQQNAGPSNSAPLAPPASWGQPPPLNHSHSIPPYAGGNGQQAVSHPAPPLSLSLPAAPTPAHSAADPLAGAFQSVLTPGTLAKLPTSSYDFSLAPDGTFPPYVSGAPATPSLGLGVGATSYPGMGGASAGFTPSMSAAVGSGAPAPSLPTPLRSLSISELYPPSFTPSGGVPPPPGHQAHTYASVGHGADFDASAWTGSFHLPSPGLTFSSSTPSWYGQGAANQGQYFARI
ncbi:hypothetical protein JCM11251_001675 [Rhodosporidiobolus azoricus]